MTLPVVVDARNLREEPLAFVHVGYPCLRHSAEGRRREQLDVGLGSRWKTFSFRTVNVSISFVMIPSDCNPTFLLFPDLV